MSVSCVRILQGFERLVMTLTEDEIFKRLAAHSQYSLPVEALNVIVETLNLIIESKSLPAEVNDLNIELQLPVEAIEKLAIILFCGF